MADKTYVRTYQYAIALRLINVIRNANTTTFIGTGFADDVEAYLDNNGTLQKLARSGDITRSNYDILVTESFNADIPYSLYLVNPSTEDGQTSNALTYQEKILSSVTDVQVDGKSVVSSQIANIDLTGKVDVNKEQNKLYGTDADGLPAVYDVDAISGIQKISVNGTAYTPTNGLVQLTDIANASLTVQKSSDAHSVYGTDTDGSPKMYDITKYAFASDLSSSNDLISNLRTDVDANTSAISTNTTNIGTNTTKIASLQANVSSIQEGMTAVQAVANSVDSKQAKDTSATDGALAVFQGGESVGSSTLLSTLLSSISTISAGESDNASSISDLSDTLAAKAPKDWKSADANTTIDNHPVSTDNSNVTITDSVLEDEAAARALKGAVTIALGAISNADGGVAIGSNVVAGASGVAIGIGANATTGVSVGQSSDSYDGQVAIGESASVVTGATNSVAIGKGSIATDANTFSVGSYADSIARKIVNVAMPTADADAATKKYVDDKVAALVIVATSASDAATKSSANPNALVLYSESA